MKCKICNSLIKPKNSFLYIHQKIKYYRCKKCNFIFQYPLTTLEKLKKLYDKRYFTENYSKNNKSFKLRKIQYNLDKKILLEFYKDSSKKKILDYGCGNGQFLSIFKSKKYGYEFNRSAKLSSKIKRVSMKESFTKKYDLIIMRGVIEHIPDFDKIVQKLCKSIKKNGLFFITATPNSNNLSFFLSNKDFNQNHPGHIYHFNNVNLSFLFLKNNFLNISTNFEYFKTPYANLKRDFNNLKMQLKYSEDKKKTVSPPAVGNMITAVFKKMV